ncbi:MAG: ribosome-associated translation inhibitor RaiA [Bacilli bacterium]
MELLIRGDKIKITKAMSDHVKEKLSKLDRYLENAPTVKATVVVKVKDHSQKVEVTIPLKSFILRAEEEQEDFYDCIDEIIDKLERQISKNKTRIDKKQNKAHKDFILNNMFASDESEDKIVKRKKIEVKPMDEEEAIIQMELLGHQFYLFNNIDTNKSAVVYKRKDGGYGVLEAE